MSGVMCSCPLVCMIITCHIYIKHVFVSTAVIIISLPLDLADVNSFITFFVIFMYDFVINK